MELLPGAPELTAYERPSLSYTARMRKRAGHALGMFTTALAAMLGSYAHAQQPLTQTEVNASFDSVSHCANTLQVDAPNSSRPGMVICTPNGADGIPYGVAGLPETSTDPASLILFANAPSTPLQRDPAVQPQPTYNLSRNEETSTIVSPNDERYVRLSGNPDGQGERTLLENSPNGKKSETLSGPVMGTYDPAHAKFGPDDRNMHQAFQYVVRGVACDTTCDGKTLGDYFTALSITRDTQSGLYKAQLGVYDVVNEQLQFLGNAEAQLQAAVSGQLVQNGSAQFLSSTIPNGIVPELRILKPTMDGTMNLEDAVRVSPGQPRNFNWQSALAGTAYEAVTTGACVASSTTLCIDSAAGDDNRFSVRAMYSRPGQFSGVGQVALFQNQAIKGGVLTFLEADNPEIFAKVKDACGFPAGHSLRNFWVFIAGLTDLEVLLTVTDEKNGNSVQFFNPNQRAYVSIQATNEALGALPCD